ncbi:MAG: helix-turn-helix transcriptional regulator [Elusimicrobia bacterium]|nr:helix-turn-helix transcriptional regulator [Elusimicrobiota bacterium]
MDHSKDIQAVAKLGRLLKSLPPDPIELALRQARTLPPEWRSLSIGRVSRALRRRFDMTQRQLALLAGLPHSKVAKIENGQDVRLNTLRRLFMGFGCELLVLPLAHLSAEKLWRRTHDLADLGLIPRRRRYSRR